jgi:hypothetical protein
MGTVPTCEAARCRCGELGPEVLVLAISDMLSSAAAEGASYVIAAVVVAGQARGHGFVDSLCAVSGGG